MIQDTSEYFFDYYDVNRVDQIDLLCDGPEVFPRFLHLIDHAQKEIGLEIYMFLNDAIGKKVLEALVTARKRGCSVRVVFDSLGSYPTNLSFFKPLLDAGGEVLEYHPVRWRDRFNLHRRNHRKLLLVDKSALVGGLNIGDPYFKPQEKGGIHDMAIEFSGEAVGAGWKLFLQTWEAQKHQTSHPNERRSNEFQNVQLIGTNHILDRWRLRRSLMYAMSQAQHSIVMLNPYFLPAPDLLTLFRRVIKRGCKVQVIVPKRSDVRAVDLASAFAQHRFLKRDVEILYYPRFLHAKAILVDEKWASVGSYNFDYQSLFRNLEVVANTTAKPVIEKLLEIIERDRLVSIPAQIDDWKRMPLWERILARVLYRLRRFL